MHPQNALHSLSTSLASRSSFHLLPTFRLGVCHWPAHGVCVAHAHQTKGT